MDATHMYLLGFHTVEELFPGNINPYSQNIPVTSWGQVLLR